SGVPSGDLCGPPVIRLTGRGTLHLLDEGINPGDLVAGQVLAAVSVELLLRRRPPVGLDDGGDATAPALVGDAGDDRVIDVRVSFEDGLDLLGVDLLPAGVDDLRTPAVHGDGAVGLHGG